MPYTAACASVLRPSRRLLESLAAKVRAARLREGLSLQEAATRAGLSRRFLVEIEAGRTNPSIGKLAALAEAFHLPLRELCDLPTRGAPVKRIALLGLRGAGKSTLGRRLAERLEVPFTELDEVITSIAGLSVAEIFELHGAGGYRRLEAEALEKWLSQHGEGVLATPGGIVSEPRTFDRLLGSCRTVWLQATPQEHWDRVVAQGDLRPMQGHPEAMDRLRALLEERSPSYARAEIHLDTGSGTPEDLVQHLVERLEAEV